VDAGGARREPLVSRHFAGGALLAGGEAMSDTTVVDYAESLAAVMRMWSTRSLSRAEMVETLESAGLTMGEAAAVVSYGITRRLFRTEEDHLQAA
jgi:hypothetical protein